MINDSEMFSEVEKNANLLKLIHYFDKCKKQNKNHQKFRTTVVPIIQIKILLIKYRTSPTSI